MEIAIATGVIILLAVGLGYWASNVLMPRFGLKTMREQPPAKQRVFWLFVGIAVLIAVFEGWAFNSHHGGAGIIVLIVVFVLPEFVVLPLRIRRSRQLAERSRAPGSGQQRP